MKRLLTAIAIAIGLSLWTATNSAIGDEPLVYEITVKAGKHDRVNIPVEANLKPYESGVGKLSAKLTTLDGTLVVSQFDPGQRRAKPDHEWHDGVVHFVLTNLKAGEEQTLRLELSETLPFQENRNADGPQLTWHNTPGVSTELRFGKGKEDDRPVLRYMHLSYDGSTPESHELTKKVFHHVFDPTTGQQLLTKGPGGLYSHHRGVFFGFSKVRYGEGKTADVWHCNNGESQRHFKFQPWPLETGPNLARQRMVLSWHGPDGEIFANETREVAAYNLPGGTLLEFASYIRGTFVEDSKLQPLHLDGDPQHAGFQFRAAQEVAEKTKEQTYYLRPDGRDKPGATRNWEHKNIGQPSNKQSENLPWNAMSFVVGGKRYTALYLDRSYNPKPARYSERDYGRFGSYFEKKLAASIGLRVRYRLWIQEGEMTVEECARLSADFVDPPKVSVRQVTDKE